MSDLLGLGSSGVLAYQRALVTVSNNIANVATEGYSRQEALLVSMPPRPIGTQSVGMGVLAQTVRRQYDEFAESNLRQSSSNLTGQAPLVQYAGRVLDLMAGQQTGLVGAMARFFDVARDVTADPASPIYSAQQGDAIADGHGLALVMRHIDQRQAQARLQGQDFCPQRPPQRPIQVRHRLVEQQQGRLADERTRQRHALLLALRQVVRAASCECRDAQQPQRVECACLGESRGVGLQPQAESHVVDHAQVGKEPGVLGHHAHRPLGRSPQRDVRAADLDAALVRQLQPRHQAQQ